MKPTTITALVKISEYIRDHLIQQGGRSVNPTGQCVYRGKDGRTCAVGCLIRDEFYYPGLEGFGVNVNNMVLTAVKQSIAKMGGPYVAAARKEALSELHCLLMSWQRYHDAAYERYLSGHPNGRSPQTHHLHVLSLHISEQETTA